MKAIKERAMKKIIVILALAVLLCAGISNATEKIVARVNGIELTEADLQKVINELLPQAFYHSSVTPDKVAELKKKALDELIKRELYYQEAKNMGMKVDASELKEALTAIKKRFSSERDYEKALKEAGVSEKEFNSYLEKRLLVEKFIQSEIMAKSRVTDEYLKDYYERNKKDYLRPEAARIKHILIKIDPAADNEDRKKKRNQAEDILKKARAGEDFTELAYNYSEDEWRVKGGDLGLIHRGRLMPELEEVAFKLKPGEISDIVETIYGYHIIKMEEKFPPTQLTFDEIKDKVKKEIEEKRRKEIEETLLKRLKEKGRVEIVE